MNKRDKLSADVERFLASGGKITHPESVPLRAVPVDGRSRRNWVGNVPAMSTLCTGGPRLKR